MTCSGWGALVGALPGLASGWGLSYPDRTSLKGRVRTLASGTAGGAARGGLLLWSGSERVEGVLAWGAWGVGVGLISAAVSPALQARLFPSVRKLDEGRTGLGLRYVFD